MPTVVKKPPRWSNSKIPIFLLRVIWLLICDWRLLRGSGNIASFLMAKFLSRERQNFKFRPWDNLRYPLGFSAKSNSRSNLRILENKERCFTWHRFDHLIPTQVGLCLWPKKIKKVGLCQFMLYPLEKKVEPRPGNASQFTSVAWMTLLASF